MVMESIRLFSIADATRILELGASSGGTQAPSGYDASAGQLVPTDDAVRPFGTPAPTSSHGSGKDTSAKKFGIVALTAFAVVVVVVIWRCCVVWKQRRERRMMQIQSARADTVLGDMQVRYRPQS